MAYDSPSIAGFNALVAHAISEGQGGGNSAAQRAWPTPKARGPHRQPEHGRCAAQRGVPRVGCERIGVRGRKPGARRLGGAPHQRHRGSGASRGDRRQCGTQGVHPGGRLFPVQAHGPVCRGDARQHSDPNVAALRLADLDIEKQS